MAVTASPIPIASYSGDTYAPRNSHRMSLRASEIISYKMRTSPATSKIKLSGIGVSSNDSSDDEDLAPIKLSAEAQAILGEDNSNLGSDKENHVPYMNGGYVMENKVRPGNRKLSAIMRNSPAGEDGSPVQRGVRVASTRPSPPKMPARDGSFMYKVHEKSALGGSAQDSRTPATQLRRIRVSGSRSQTKSPPSALSKSRSAENERRTMPHPNVETDNNQAEVEGEDFGPVYPSTIMRPRKGEEPGAHSTMRVRRIGTGTLLNGPIRRGMIRRQSEDEEQGQAQEQRAERGDTPEVEQGRRAPEAELQDLPDDTLISYGSPKRPASFERGPFRLAMSDEQHSPVRSNSPIRADSSTRNKSAPISSDKQNPAPGSSHVHISSSTSSSNRKPIFKIASLPPLESAHDQENEPPPTFKRPKSSMPLLGAHEGQQSASPKLRAQQPSVQESPSRQPLAARPNNTPHRPAPAPPPKMSLIEAATSAGANSRSKKSVHYVLNGRTYRRLDMIGRGGSSRVFRIMAENFKIFALKRVNLEEADMAAIAGYKGEIDLLKKLENVDRVIRLFDYEVNEEKGVLSVMMELGESDFNKMLNEQVKTDNAKLDVTFTRHYWKEMLECVKAVHDHDIVHSDLKPANFLLVKGQLKLIDFGIAGAIQDNTVNVHRENQIGTPNYMSPESLVCHTPAAGQAAGTKLLKLGKPSDVWSLGCILYQMTYGQPPFAHITKQFERIMSIPNPKVEIQFPGVGIGGVVVPFGLIKTLRRCLQRDQTLRPTIDELLSESDPFLHPVAISTEMLGRVIGNVVGYCRKREEKLKAEGRLTMAEEGLSVLPKDEEMRAWPGAFYEKLKEAAREGTAW